MHFQIEMIGRQLQDVRSTEVPEFPVLPLAPREDFTIDRQCHGVSSTYKLQAVNDQRNNPKIRIELRLKSLEL